VSLPHPVAVIPHPARQSRRAGRITAVNVLPQFDDLLDGPFVLDSFSAQPLHVTSIRSSLAKLARAGEALLQPEVVSDDDDG